jgi:hypothetical protein
MPIKWSAVKVCEATDEIAEQVSRAEPFLAEARARAETARRIADLPQYIDQYLVRLIAEIGRIDYVRAAIEAVRDAIPDGAIEAEQDHIRHGIQQSLIQ